MVYELGHIRVSSHLHGVSEWAREELCPGPNNEAKNKFSTVDQVEKKDKLLFVHAFLTGPDSCGPKDISNTGC
jgi:hypothetical protein